MIYETLTNLVTIIGVLICYAIFIYIKHRIKRKRNKKIEVAY